MLCRCRWLSRVKPCTPITATPSCHRFLCTFSPNHAADASVCDLQPAVLTAYELHTVMFARFSFIIDCIGLCKLLLLGRKPLKRLNGKH